MLHKIISGNILEKGIDLIERYNDQVNHETVFLL